MDQQHPHAPTESERDFTLDAGRKEGAVPAVGVRRVTRRRYALLPGMVRALVPPDQPGHYILFTHRRPLYVGRSDTSVRRRLLQHAYRRRAAYFQFDVHTCIANAWLAECAYFHALRGTVDNVIHPNVPDESVMRCPFCPPGWRPHLFANLEMPVPPQQPTPRNH